MTVYEYNYVLLGYYLFTRSFCSIPTERLPLVSEASANFCG
jgi:hypothetical protein